MDVYQAVTTRRAVRAFTDRPVPRAVLDRVLNAAARTPSGGNLQPWRVHVLSGAPLAELKKRAGERTAAGDPGDEPDYAMYPADLVAPYRRRRIEAAAQRFEAARVRRDDAEGRQRALAANWQCFGAPVLLLVSVDRRLGAAQWADVGMYVQTVMLLLRAEGLHSCTQMAWSVYHRTVADVLPLEPELILYCGVSIGYEDPSAPFPRTRRAPLSETVTFLGGPIA